jgi:type I restriction enzyme M protein
MPNNANGSNGATVGFEDQLWAAADRMRGGMDASEYKHVALGLLFLKYISDAFEEKHALLTQDEYGDPEDPDEYLAENIFWVPEKARWAKLKDNARQPTIGKAIDDAMDAIEKANDSLKGVLPKDYARPALDKQMLGDLIDLFSNIGLGGREARSKDMLGRVYEYFLGKFASAEGRAGGEFYTPRCIVRLLVQMLEPYHGRIYDPCCGSGGMFVQSEKFVQEHGGRLGDIAIYGQEMNHTTWRLAKMNMAVRGIDADIQWNSQGTFRADKFRDMKFDFILANPPFNVSDWGGEGLKEDVRWENYGVPPAGNANYAWLSHIVHHLKPRGTAGVVLANGSMSTNQTAEKAIRRSMLEADLVDCMIALPGQLFYSTQIPACLWFLARSKEPNGFRDRRGETLFIDARKMGVLMDRVRRELTDADIQRIAATYHAWRGEEGAGEYEDIPGFCKSAKLEDIQANDYVLTPGRYVGAEAAQEDDVPFAERMAELTDRLFDQMREGRELDEAIRRNLEGLGYVG